MGRLPVHVHVFPYRKDEKGQYEFALFQRSDYPTAWQGICGGGEEGETLEESAFRESEEEGGITNPGPLYKLECVSFVPATIFPKWAEVWGKDVVVIPMHFYGMPYSGDITISEEHLAYRWLKFEEAHELMIVYDQKTPLYELNERLLRGNLIRQQNDLK